MKKHNYKGHWEVGRMYGEYIFTNLNALRNFIKKELLSHATYIENNFYFIEDMTTNTLVEAKTFGQESLVWKDCNKELIRTFFVKDRVE